MGPRSFVSLILAAACGLMSGCGFALSPPVQSAHYGAPERLREGELELHGAAAGFADNGVSAPYFGQARVGYGVRDWIAVEGGGTFAQDLWAMGYLGPRLTLSPKPDAPIHATADLELGLGLGAGGLDFDGESDNRDWHKRLAFGGYSGVGIGLHIHWFALYGRLRVQGSHADGLPPTFWGSGVGGMQFRIKDRVDLFVAGGYANHATKDLARYYGLYEFGVAVHFDVVALARAGRARRDARRAKPE